MNSLTITPAMSSASSRFYKLCATILNTSTKRHNSSYRRHRSKSNIKPDPAFLPSKTEAHDHIIHNPPPSMPNVYHTPTIFLPKEDPRKTIPVPSPSTAKPLLANTPAFTPAGKERLPPAVRKPYEKRYHLTEQNLDEMRRLRTEDPLTWSAKKLALKYDCSVLFVGMATEGIAKRAGKQEIQKKLTEIVKSRWGQKRRVAREDRQIRREMSYRDA